MSFFPFGELGKHVKGSCKISMKINNFGEKNTKNMVYKFENTLNNIKKDVAFCRHADLVRETENKKINNDQELVQSDPTSCPQNQKGNN